MTLGGDKPIDVGGPSFMDGLSDAAVIAHEVKSPLATIRQLALEIESGVLASNDVSVVAEQIRLTSERSLRLASNLAKAERLQTTLFDTAPLNAYQLCQDIQYEMAPLYRANEKRLVIRRIRRVPPVIANHDLLRRVILNFADNALRYSDEKGVVELYLELLRTKDVLRIGVRDYGPALPSKLWRELQRATPSSMEPVHARPDSSGLGLMLAQRFAAAMGGSVGAIRHRDGASFYVDVSISKQLSLL